MAERVYNVLFLCTGNSARSIIAEAVLERLGGGRFKGFSAGSHPTGEVNPHTLALLEAFDFDTTFARSKSWDEFAAAGAPGMDFVITVCGEAARETCPVWPGHPAASHWSLPDPAATEGSEAEIAAAFRRVYDRLCRVIARFRGMKIGDLDGAGIDAWLAALGRRV
jgi:arsenate reductase